MSFYEKQKKIHFLLGVSSANYVYLRINTWSNFFYVVFTCNTTLQICNALLHVKLRRSSFLGVKDSERMQKAFENNQILKTFN